MPQQMTTRRILLALAGIVALAFAWRLLTAAPPLPTARVTVGDAAEVVYATGVVEPVSWAKVSSLPQQRIIEICHCEGKAVKRGEVLARLDDYEERAALTELTARRDRLKEDAERIRGLVERNVSSPRLLRREADAGARIRMPASPPRMTASTISSCARRWTASCCAATARSARSPASARRMCCCGSDSPSPCRSSPTSTRTTSRASLWATRCCSATKAKAPSRCRQRFSRITPKGDSATKTFRAYFALPDDTPLMIGMSVEANIVVREARHVLLVPAEAVSNGTAQRIVDGHVAVVPVVTGITGNRMIEIVSGLSAGDAVTSPSSLE